MTLKYSFYLLCICSLGVYAKVDISMFSHETQDMVKTLHETCIKEVGVDEEIVNKVIDGNLSEDDKLKCYMKCVMVEGGVMDEKGETNTEAFVELLPESLKEAHRESFTKCSAKADNDDLCEKAFEIVKCSKEEDEDNFFFF
ncbi:unnamed protein product [Brassicogethes aeneus]|uniref:Uncharacterized protein n=1 Tax=Brassicogethes aeneus TaxID=1431903 RepID=A0A9P0AZZ4_BRAAE|nr:unnamed protein product [Brassicogethes aeneus]